MGSATSNQIKIYDSTIEQYEKYLKIQRTKKYSHHNIYDTKLLHTKHIDHHIGIQFKIKSDKAKNYAYNLFSRNDCNAFYRAKNNAHMLFSKSTSKKVLDFDIVRAYGGYLLDLASSLVEGPTYICTKGGLKVNLYTLNPKDLCDSINLLNNKYNTSVNTYDIFGIDNEEETLHIDVEPKFAGINTNKLILTFVILRGFNGYTSNMGKCITFPNCSYTQENYERIILNPQNDSDDYFEILIFFSDIVEHGSTIWNIQNETVKKQFEKTKISDITDDKSQPARLSITIPFYFQTEDPKKLWNDITKKLM